MEPNPMPQRLKKWRRVVSGDRASFAGNRFVEVQQHSGQHGPGGLFAALRFSHGLPPCARWTTGVRATASMPEYSCRCLFKKTQGL